MKLFLYVALNLTLLTNCRSHPSDLAKHVPNLDKLNLEMNEVSEKFGQLEKAKKLIDDEIVIYTGDGFIHYPKLNDNGNIIFKKVSLTKKQGIPDYVITAADAIQKRNSLFKDFAMDYFTGHMIVPQDLRMKYYFTESGVPIVPMQSSENLKNTIPGLFKSRLRSTKQGSSIYKKKFEFLSLKGSLNDLPIEGLHLFARDVLGQDLDVGHAEKSLIKINRLVERIRILNDLSAGQWQAMAKAMKGSLGTMLSQLPTTRSEILKEVSLPLQMLKVDNQMTKVKNSMMEAGGQIPKYKNKKIKPTKSGKPQEILPEDIFRHDPKVVHSYTDGVQIHHLDGGLFKRIFYKLEYAHQNEVLRKMQSVLNSGQATTIFPKDFMKILL